MKLSWVAYLIICPCLEGQTALRAIPNITSNSITQAEEQTRGTMMAHLRPLENSEVDQELREMFEHYENTRGFCPNSVKTMARRPNISKVFGQLNQVILYESQ